MEVERENVRQVIRDKYNIKKKEEPPVLVPDDPSRVPFLPIPRLSAYPQSTLLLKYLSAFFFWSFISPHSFVSKLLMNLLPGVGGRKRKTPAEMAAEAAKAEEDDSLINSMNLLH